MVINLTKQEISFAKKLAKKRHNAKNTFIRNRGILMKEGSVYDPHTIGLIGEMAYAKFIGEKVDEEIYAVRDKGQDFNKVEVKTITYFGDGEPELKIKQKQFKDCCNFPILSPYGELDPLQLPNPWKPNQLLPRQ